MVFRVGKVEEWFSVWEGRRMVFRVGKVGEWFLVAKVEEWFSSTIFYGRILAVLFSIF